MKINPELPPAEIWAIIHKLMNEWEEDIKGIYSFSFDEWKSNSGKILAFLGQMKKHKNNKDVQRILELIK